MVEAVLGVVGLKAVLAVVLAVGAALASRWVQRPALVHVLWIVVLLELLVPPLFEIGVLPPASESVASIPATQTLSIEPAIAHAISVEPPRAATGGSLADSLPLALGALWLAGAVGVVSLTAVRLRRFARLLPHASDASPDVRQAATRLARRLGLSQCPPVRVVPAILSPMLLPRWGSPEVLFPSALLERLERGERDALLAHELAHVRRRDHWVRWLELIAAALFWWHPVVWWARRGLRRVEEHCCDGLVLEEFPERAKDYATGLVKTVEFLADDRVGLPSLASGVGGARNLEERLTMIVTQHTPRRLSRVQRIGLTVVAAALLLVLPTRAGRSPEEAAELREHESRTTAVEAEVHESMIALEHQAAELEGQLRDVRARQRELEVELKHSRAELELQRLDVEAAGKEAAGDFSAAERARRDKELLRERVALEAEDDHEDSLRCTLIETELANQRGERERVALLEARAAEMEARLAQAEYRSQLQDSELEQRGNAMMFDRMREQMVLLQEAGREQEAAEIGREMALRQGAVELQRHQRDHHEQLRELHDEIEALGAELELVQSKGLDREVARLSAEIRELEEILRQLRIGSVH